MNAMSSWLDGHWLTGLIAWPLVAALLLWGWPNRHQVRPLAVVATLLELLGSLIVVATVQPHQGGFQLMERSDWIPSLNIHYHLGIDGLSAPFLPATALLFTAVVVGSWRLVPASYQLYFALLLVLEGLMIGIFTALDTILFFIFWELTIIPIYFLISLYGIGPQRRFAAIQYTLFMLAGGVALLAGLVLLALHHPGGVSFDLPQLLVQSLTQPHPVAIQIPIFLLLLVGFAVKVPLFPLHSWLPLVVMAGPFALSATLVGLKLGVYGLIRFALPLAPQAAQQLHWLLAGLGVIGVIYGALLAMVQSNLRQLLAFSSMSHVGLVVLSLASFSMAGLQGALLQLLNFTLIGSILFLIAGFIHYRLGSTDWIHLGGLARVMPITSSFALLFGMASMALPMTAGFPAEQLMLAAIFQSHIGPGLAALGGQILAATYFIQYYRRAFLGPLNSSIATDTPDLYRHEQLIVMLFFMLVLGIGIVPSVVVDWTRPSAQAWLLGMIGH
ncbi:MAG: NADH-quinone oxidoreductase subunit M [Magnetococcales bacterium]|nr:NADH-quinone oxidoreductase subunit M [Magnetococcales bacterium]